jgi:hypothetical protein
MNKFVAALAVATSVCLAGCGVAVRSANRGFKQAHNTVTSLGIAAPGRHGQLSSGQRAWAQSAWKYFETNTNPSTGLVKTNESTSQVTMWSVADYMAATIIARDFHFLTESDARLRLRATLQFLNSMELFQGRVPNQRYSVTSGQKIDVLGKERETGWSSVDMGRLLIWLNAVKREDPVLSQYVDEVVARWNLCNVIIIPGDLRSGGWSTDGKIQTYEEGNAGYQEYALAGYAMWGFNLSRAAKLDPFEQEKIEGYIVTRDASDPRLTGHYSPIDTLPSVLEGLESGWISPYPEAGNISQRDMAVQIFKIQQARYLTSGILTARSSHGIANPPYLVYDSVFVDGYPWNTISATGEYQPQDAIVSTSASLGMWVLWKSSYTDALMKQVGDAATPDHGWYEGIMEKGGGLMKVESSSTNATVLESLDYYVHGPRFASAKYKSLANIQTRTAKSITCGTAGSGRP